MKQAAWTFVVAAMIGAGSAQVLLGQAVPPAAPAPPKAAISADIDLSAMDSTVDACQDFYQRACGGFIKSTALTPERTEVDLTEEKFEANLDAGLTKLFATRAPENSELGRLETFYQSCLGDQQSSARLVRQWLDRIDAARTPADIRSLLLALHEIGVDPFFSYAGAPDPKDLTKYRGEIDDNNIWQDPATVERTFTLAGVPAAQAAVDAKAVASIIDTLRKNRATGDDANRENPTTLARLEKDAPAIDWPRYFALVGASPTRPLNLTSKLYLPAVSHEMSSRSPAELRAYLRWAFLFSLRGELPPPYNQAFGDIGPSRRVALNDPPKRCRDATLRAMGIEFSRQYAERILGEPAKMAAMKIGQSIQSEIATAVEQADWLSPAARHATADKLRNTDLKIGFPDHWPEVGNFVLGRDTFFANVLAARRYEEHRSWRRANEPRSRKNWDMIVYPWVGTGMAAARLATPNGFPDQYTNSMIITAAFLNLPRFDKDAPPEINYGGFGDVFAHEFVHIAETHDFGAFGQAHELWSPADIAAAKKQDQCVIDQASASPAPPGSHVAGEQNFSENVADLGAIRLSYNALATKLGARLNQPDASGMTPAKRFFYKYAQTYCVAATPTVLRQLVADDPHGLPSYRVNGPLSNLPAFGETFGCKAGTPMRRADANICRVW